MFVFALRARPPAERRVRDEVDHGLVALLRRRGRAGRGGEEEEEEEEEAEAPDGVLRVPAARQARHLLLVQEGGGGGRGWSVSFISILFYFLYVLFSILTEPAVLRKASGRRTQVLLTSSFLSRCLPAGLPANQSAQFFGEVKLARHIAPLLSSAYHPIPRD